MTAISQRAGRRGGATRRPAATIAALLLLSACAHLPSGAPTAREFRQADPAAGQPAYALVDLDAQTAQAMARQREPDLEAFAGLGGYHPSLVLRPGDTVTVTVFEVSPVPLLGASPSAGGGAGAADSPGVGGHVATIPPQLVELDGAISIPFGGQVKVAGSTPRQAAARIARALSGKATDPQVVVTRDATQLDAATVGGEVARPGVIPLTVRSERVLDVVAAAGGSKYPTFDSDVQLVRDGRVSRANLQHLVDDPDGDVAVRPGDGVYVVHSPRTFSVLGSALKVSQYDFNAERVSLAEAVARSGGGNGQTSDVGQIYLLRFAALAQPGRETRSDEPVPVAYHLDLKQAGGYFLAQRVQMRDKDVILVADADAVELEKLLGLVRGFTGVYFDVKRYGQ